MASREDFGSWLEGGTSAGQGSSPVERLGLPSSGPGSPAPLTRRIVALLVDWAAAMLISYLVADANSLATLGIFALENLLLVSTVGFTIGHRLLRLQVRVLGAPAGTPVGLVRGAVRVVLLCLVIPAVVWGPDGRGLHDRGAGTVIVRR
ncbi:RDD family protein [Isoptericola cucumis]|uniref:RDD family protein n=1 Tax=Isoptericola cucumis TaxID=1776856 RepID=A0ABQ2BDZ1_9MICO|nr:RDD family protein [Isoptericola cucumis]GGI12147.1 RDD family protein [Isoptericola cucumis]